MTPSDDPRSVPLAGTMNTRDVGGYVTPDGPLRTGRLYRSDALFALTDDDRRELDRRGIRTVIDLRGDDERALAPNRLDGLPVREEHRPLSERQMAEFLAEDAGLDQLYDELLEVGGDRIAEVVRAIADRAGEPTIVHCTAGKDRTGLVIALVLSLVGVSRDDVLDDYEETERRLPAALLDDIVARLRAGALSGSANLDELVRSSPRRALARVLDRIDERHGSVEGWARDHGLGDDDLAALQRALLGD